MSLIRNGGFERGDIKFWEVSPDGSLEINTVEQKYGIYCGKYTMLTTGVKHITSKDYIKVNPAEILNWIIWVKSSSTSYVYPALYLYDMNYRQIKTIVGNSKIMNGTYIDFNDQYIIPAECQYVKVGIQITTGIPSDLFYIDGCMVNIIDEKSSIAGIIDLTPVTIKSGTGDTSSDVKSMKQFSSYYASLCCVFVSGTTPSLDVKVFETGDYGRSIEIGSFSSVTEVEMQRIDLLHCLGQGMYISYNINPEDGSFEFGVAVIGKR